MTLPTLVEVRAGAKLRSTVSSAHAIPGRPSRDRLVEVFRLHDGTFWWVNTRLLDDADPVIVQVEEITPGEVYREVPRL